MSSWNSDISFSISMNEQLDELYRRVFGVSKINRFTRNDGEAPHILDKEFHIDLVVTLANDMQLTGQEKVRRGEYALRYDDFTLEFMSNKSGIEGEFFKLCTDFYTYCWGDDSGLLKAYIFKPVDFKIALSKGLIVGSMRQNTTHSTASFFAYPFKDFKDDWFIYKYGRL